MVFIRPAKDKTDGSYFLTNLKIRIDSIHIMLQLIYRQLKTCFLLIEFFVVKALLYFMNTETCHKQSSFRVSKAFFFCLQSCLELHALFCVTHSTYHKFESPAMFYTL